MLQVVVGNLIQQTTTILSGFRVGMDSLMTQSAQLLQQTPVSITEILVKAYMIGVTDTRTPWEVMEEGLPSGLSVRIHNHTTHLEMERP